MKTCPDCTEEVEDDDWSPEIVGSGNTPGVCLECAEYYINKEELFEEEFTSSLRDASPSIEIEEDDGDTD